MSNITTYMVLIFGISIGLYLMGYTSPFMAMFNNIGQDTNIAEAILNSLLAIFTNPIFLAGLGISAVASFITGGSYSVMYLFPIVMLVAFANYFVLPTSFILQADFPLELKLIINTFLNLFMVLAIIEFVRGG